MSTGVAWTAERDETLRTAWLSTSATAVEIAKSMGGFDHTADEGRNAVIGRARRLGLTRKPKTDELTDAQRAAVVKAKESIHSRKSYLKKLAEQGNADAEPKRRSKTVAEPKSAAGPEFPAESWSFELPFGELRDFSTQQPNQCRFPDPENEVGPDYLYCGAETLPGESYCGHCAKVSHPPHNRAITEERRDQMRANGRVAGYASIRSRGRVMGRAVAMATAPVLDSEARV